MQGAAVGGVISIRSTCRLCGVQFHGAAVRLPFGRPQNLQQKTLARSSAVCKASEEVQQRSNPFSKIKEDQKLESLKLPRELRESVEEAIEDQRFQLTVGDAAAKAGVSVFDAEKALKALASDTQANLLVSNDGTIQYKFNDNFRGQLAQKSFWLSILPAVDTAANVGLYIFKLAFGLGIIAATIAVFLAIMVLSSSSSSSDDRRRSEGGGGGMYMSPGWGLSPFDMYYIWNPWYTPYTYVEYAPYETQREEVGGLQSIFSFVFGDGDVNEITRDKVRWVMIGEVIRQNNGVVTAEQIKPYLDITDEYESNDSSEGYMLPVLVKFEGTPEVDSQGRIFYEFQRIPPKPQLDMSSYQDVPPYLQLEEQPLTLASQGWQLFAGGLGVVFAVLNVYLAYQLSAPGAMVYLQKALPTVAAALPFLRLLSGAYLGIPLVRWLLNRGRNEKILEGNRLRKMAARRLKDWDPEIQDKLKVAQERGMKLLKAQQGQRVVFSTEEDVLGKNLEKEEWDRKLRGQ